MTGLMIEIVDDIVVLNRPRLELRWTLVGAWSEPAASLGKTSFAVFPRTPEEAAECVRLLLTTARRPLDLPLGADVCGLRRA